MSQILLIDDENSFREVMVSLLQHHGYDVLQTDDGVSGVQIAQSFIPDVILSDIMMPEIDGTEMLARLREDPQTAGIPIIFVTADSQYSQKIKDDTIPVMSKPFEIEALLKQIEELLANRTPMV